MFDNDTESNCCKSFLQHIPQALNTDTEDEMNELRGSITMLNIKVEDLESKLKHKITAHKSIELLLVEKSSLNKELESRCQKLSAECDALQKNAGAVEEVCVCCSI